MSTSMKNPQTRSYQPQTRHKARFSGWLPIDVYDYVASKAREEERSMAFMLARILRRIMQSDIGSGDLHPRTPKAGALETWVVCLRVPSEAREQERRLGAALSQEPRAFANY